MSRAAVVVFVEVPDEIGDPEAAAHLAISQKLLRKRVEARGASGPFAVTVVDVLEIGLAMGDSYLRLVPSAKAFRGR